MLEDKVKSDGNSPQPREHWGPFAGAGIGIMGYGLSFPILYNKVYEKLPQEYSGIISVFAPLGFVMAGMVVGIAIERWYRRT